MPRIRHLAGFGAVALLAGGLAFVGISTQAGARATSVRRATSPAELLSTQGTTPWPEQTMTGTATLAGQVPLSVAESSATFLRRHAATAQVTLSFGLPLRDKLVLDKLIAQQAKTHQYATRSQLYARFSPPQAQVDALTGWLKDNGFRITHLGADRMAVSATASAATVERALHLQLNDYVKPASTYRGIQVKPYAFYANTTAPTIPARLGVQSISGLSDVDRFFTQSQLDAAKKGGTGKVTDCGDEDNAVINPLCVDVRAGGYFPVDLRGLYNITGHGFDGTGQTIGFTLWTAAERQQAMTAFATNTGDQLITIDPNCVASGNSPTVPSSCTTQTVAADHLLFILENGNLDNNFGSNVETALDIESAHAVATHVGMKYYAADCASTTPPGSGLTNAGCNGSDVGLEETLEDAANDPTLHSVSNSWAFGGEAEWGAADPFLIAAENSLTIGTAAGTSFYFSTGDSGTYQSGYPSDSPHVVAVGGTSTYSTSDSATWSTSVTWSGGGSFCSNVFARPAWQTGAGVTANAPCPGRTIPDVSAIADPNTGVRFTSTTSAAGGTQSGQVGGTSLAAPVMNGLQAVTQNFIAAQTYPGPTPKMGFTAPVMYQMGNNADYASFYRDVECGNTANPTSGPDGDAAGKGWDAATGWGEPDWYQFSIGYAMALGATNLSVPPSLSRHFAWTCAKTPSNSTERSLSCPSVSTCYAVGNPSGATPWYGKFITAGAWGAVNTFFKSTDGGQSWFPSNSDMYSIACTGSGTCTTVGAGGRARRTTDGGATWADVATAPNNNKPLTQINCPSSSICYAVGDRGNAMKSTDGGASWSWLNTTDGNPLYGLSCPSTSTCYATDIYGHVVKTSDGGANWAWQTTPITTPGTAVPGSGGPNPFGGLMAISCPSVSTCVASGLYVVPTGQLIPSIDPPIITTTDGGANWTLRTSNAGTAAASTTTLSAASAVGATNIKVASVATFTIGAVIIVDFGTPNAETATVQAIGTAGALGTGITLSAPLTLAHANGATVARSLAPNFLHAISCVTGTTSCTAVGRGGAIVTTTDLVNWTPATSNTTNMLNSVLCSSTSFCIAVGQNGTVDTWNGATWTATTGNGGTGMLADVDCDGGNLVCYATGKQGVTLVTTTGGSSWTQQAGGGTTQAMNGIACPNDGTCYAVGAAGTILETGNGGQTWLGQASGTTAALNGISCTSTSACAAVGAVVSGAATVRTTTDGTAWNAGTGAGANALNSVSCPTATVCVAVGAAGAASVSADGGATWAVKTTGVSAALNALSCPGAACYATGAVASGSAVLIKSTDGGTTWSPQASGTPNVLSGIACLSEAYCFAGGTLGTVVMTKDGGANWAQQGNPLSGPTSALNVTNSAGLALLGATCTSARCMFGTGTQGDIMTTPLLTVTVHATGVYGTAPALTGLAHGNAAISYSPGSETANVTGTLTCTTTAVAASPVGSYPISDCSGLADDGFNIVYDYAGSNYAVTKAPLTVTADPQSRPFGTANPPLTATLSGFVLGQNLGSSGVTGTAACSTTAATFSSGGNYPITCAVGTLTAANYSFGPFVAGTLTVTYPTPCITGTRTGKLDIGAGQTVCIGQGGRVTGPVTVSPGGQLDVEGGTITGPVSSTGGGVIRLCGATVTGPLTITNSTGLVLVGGDAATGPCDGNTVTGPVSITNNTAGVEFNGNGVTGPLTITGNTGTLPPPDAGSVHAAGNTVSGPVKIQP